MTEHAGNQLNKAQWAMRRRWAIKEINHLICLKVALSPLASKVLLNEVNGVLPLRTASPMDGRMGRPSYIDARGLSNNISGYQ